MKYVRHFFLFILTSFISYNLHAQVPVVKEPRHKVVLDNAYIRLIEVHLAPADTTLYHIHSIPSVIIFISQSKIGTQDMQGNGLPSGRVFPAQTVFMDYGKTPVTHRVYNDSSNIFHVMDIELVKPAPARDSCTFLQQSNVERTINEKLVNIYTLNFDKDQSLNLPAGNCAYLAVCISGEINSANKKIITGEYMFFDPGTAIKLSSEQKNSSCVLLQLK